MSKSYPGDWVFRSVLFVPGHLEKMMRGAADSEADCLILDLEDAVPAGKKATARREVHNILEEGIYTNLSVFVRVNSFETGLTQKDVESVACSRLHGFVYPWANRPEDIQNFHRQLEQAENSLGLAKGYFSLIAVIEAPLGVINAHAIAQASDRIVGLIFGCEDFLAELQGRHNQDEIALTAPRAQVAMAARAVGITPIDTPYVRARDLAGLRNFARTGRNLGMAGGCALTPRQATVINEIYTPTVEEIQQARSVIEASENRDNLDRGVFIVLDKFISPPTVKAARKTLARHEAIRSFEEFRSRSQSKRS